MSIFSDQLFLLLTTPLFVVAIALEWGIGLWNKRSAYELKDTATTFYLMTLNGLLDLAMAGVTLLFLSWFYAWRPIHFAPQGVPYWIALFFLQDFFYYVLHYTDHHCRLFWATHVTHHSSEHFNFSTGLRSSVFEPLYRLWFFAPIALLGFQPADIIAMYAMMQVIGVFVHTDRVGKLGPLEWIFVTPSHHRVHHGSNPKYLDKNIGMTLIVWDRVFGTFVPEDDGEPVRYGVVKPPATRGPVNIVMHEWRDMVHDVRNARSWRESFGYIFGPPGWKPAATATTEPSAAPPKSA